MSFFFAIFYLIAEYMRPQSMYDALSGFPLAQIAIIGFIISIIIEGRRLNNFNFQNILLLMYLFWFLVSSIFAFKPELAWPALVDFSKWVIIYFLLINTINDRRRLYIFLMVFLLLNFKYTQFAVRKWREKGFYTDFRGLNEGRGIGSSFFQNPNDFGVAVNSILGISYYMISSDINTIFKWFKMRWFHIALTITVPIAVLTTSSRGSALALGVVCLGIWYKSKRKFIGVVVLIIAATAFVSLIPEKNWVRFQRMGDEGDRTSQVRLELWRVGIQMTNEYPLTGVGPNNFVYVNQNYYHSTRIFTDIYAQHNVYLQAASELGYPGLILFISMIIGCFYNQRKTRKILREKHIDDPFLYGLSHGLDVGVVGFSANGFFITVLYYPFFWMLLILSVALLDIVKQLAEKRQKLPSDNF